MEKTKIDWCDSTWNPITGCLHKCEYCYARKIAKRFGFHAYEPSIEERILLEMPVSAGKKVPYPFDFQPTFHKYRLDEYKEKAGRKIFVCSMGDMFGKWVPEKWKTEVLIACCRADQHNYFFLTKNPSGIPRTSNIYNNVFGSHNENFWFGTSITCQSDLEYRLWSLLQVQGHIFLSVEPLLGELDLEHIWVKEKNKEVLLSFTEKKAYYMGGAQKYRMPEWVVIGAETGNRKNRIIPKREWIENIVLGCKTAEIPIFMKASLEPIWGAPLIQEYPINMIKNR